MDGEPQLRLYRRAIALLPCRDCLLCCPSQCSGRGMAPLNTSNDKTRRVAGTYESYEGSPMSKGQLQHDLWGVKPPSDRWDWDALRADIAAHGVRNSLLVAPMPTASTSQASTPLPDQDRGAGACEFPFTEMRFPSVVTSKQDRPVWEMRPLITAAQASFTFSSCRWSITLCTVLC